LVYLGPAMVSTAIMSHSAPQLLVLGSDKLEKVVHGIISSIMYRGCHTHGGLTNKL
jgi:membrane protein CcdC involved in cytochrome C biogenesis